MCVCVCVCGPPSLERKKKIGAASLGEEMRLENWMVRCLFPQMKVSPSSLEEDIAVVGGLCRSVWGEASTHTSSAPGGVWVGVGGVVATRVRRETNYLRA